MDMVFAWKEWFAFQHLGKDTASAPDVDLNIILLPGKHDFWRSIISCGHVTGHLRILNASQSKIADLKIAIFVHQNV